MRACISATLVTPERFIGPLMNMAIAVASSPVPAPDIMLPPPIMPPIPLMLIGVPLIVPSMVPSPASLCMAVSMAEDEVVIPSWCAS